MKSQIVDFLLGAVGSPPNHPDRVLVKSQYLFVQELLECSKMSPDVI